ncbi:MULTISPECIES: efflux RND transporter periplasmic adaptor subunit [Arcobacteraceae]|uniref:efflux RND transporter periplasmic adaptor subunit n=1 Tax=Arcobacteraceae TaxID=2808963 RepID=UPI0015614E53|nr:MULTISPECIES: efflux RND transporter periplasmic adaptor subunit [Arcobacteraceae]
MIKNLLLICITSIYIFANDIELSGSVISDNEKIITSRNMGLIKDVYVNEGSFVKKGQLLYEIDSSNIDSLKQEALLNIKIQENNLANININYNRYKRLYKQDLVPKYDVEQLKLNLVNTKNMLLIAKAKLKEVNSQYSYLKIKAPNDGLIIKKSIKVGEMAMPLVPAFILTDLSSLKIKTDISESNLSKIKLNQEVDVNIPSINLNTKGQISAIIPNVNTITHSFILKVSFDKKDARVYPGMYSKLLIKPLN